MKRKEAYLAPAEKDKGETKKPVYSTPKLVVHSGGEFIRKLGPAQACSPSPGF